MFRFRTEQTSDRRIVIIQDYASTIAYVIDVEHKTLRKTQMKPVGPAAPKIAGDVSPVEEARAMARRNPQRFVEDLGSQFINGVAALGVRITTTIPVGAIGNDQELKSVSERWYSNGIHAGEDGNDGSPQRSLYLRIDQHRARGTRGC